MIICNFESGRTANLRHVVVGTIALNKEKEVLLVKRSPRLHVRPNKYTIPGGFLDRDENTEEGALRELREESGYTGEIISLFQITVRPDRPKEDRQNIDFVYIAKIVGGEPLLNDEVTEIKWFTKENLPSDEEFAFDHRAIILQYFDYLEAPFPLPLVK